MRLWRPVGLKEMALVFESRMKAYPPRLPEQPIFYPTLNREYAEEIARSWNTRESDCAGYVTSFRVVDSFSARYPRRVVGASRHEEFWVPAEELQELNANIEGLIEVEAAFFAEGFQGLIPDSAGLKGKNAGQQFVALAKWLEYSSFDVWCETYVNRKAVFLHYLFWTQLNAAAVGATEDEKSKLMELVRRRWANSDIPFPLPGAAEESGK
jgi:hypothetical protein